MKIVKVNKSEVLLKAEENREHHRIQYLETLDGYKKDMKEFYLKELERLSLTKEEKSFSPKDPPDAPISFLRDYDTHIKMFNWSTEKVIDLTEAEFKNLILDEWYWREAWSKTYNSRAKSPIYKMDGNLAPEKIR